MPNNIILNIPSDCDLRPELLSHTSLIDLALVNHLNDGRITS